MKRLLFISHRVPFPPDKGERVRAFHEIKALSQHFRVTVAALAHRPEDWPAAEHLKPWCERVIAAPVGGVRGVLRGALGLVRGRSVTEGFFASRRMTRMIRQAVAAEPFDLVMGYSSSTPPYVLSTPAKARVMDLVDADSAKWSAYAETSRWPRSLLFRRESRAVRSLEQDALERCAAVLVVSDAEARLLPARPDNLAVIGNGVDTEYFKPLADPPAGPPNLVFTGTMDYHPNVDGVCRFVREVWPELSRQMPDLTFTVVGRDPAPAVRRLADVPGVTVTGSVPDVRPYLSAASLAVVPLRVARGVQNKILEAMAAGRAVVASPAAIEGLEVSVGSDLLQAETPAQWVEQVRGLLADTSRRQAVQRSARLRIESAYTWEARLRPLVSLALALADGGPCSTFPERNRKAMAARPPSGESHADRPPSGESHADRPPSGESNIGCPAAVASGTPAGPVGLAEATGGPAR